jgi:hypothetical protein
MKAKNLIFIFFLIFYLNSFAQINPFLKKSVVDINKEKAEKRVRNFYSDLTLLGGNGVANEEKQIIINQTLRFFEDKQVYIFNDIDLTKKQPIYIESETYLNNIKLYYSNSTVEFEIDSLKISDVYAAKDYYFLKVEVFREMTVTLDNQKIKETNNLDFYIKYVPDLIDCQLYSIKLHEDNLNEFTPVKIIPDSPNPKGTFMLRTNPPGATITIDKKPGFKEFTDYEFNEQDTGTFTVNLNKPGYLPVKTTIKIEANKNLEKEIHLALIDTPIVDNGDRIRIEQERIRKEQERINSAIKKHGRNQKIWGISTLATAGAGGLMMLASNKKYDEYQNSTSSNATDLYNTSKLYNNLGYGILGVSGICAIGFIAQTSKKGKAKKLQVSTNGSSAMVTYHF